MPQYTVVFEGKPEYQDFAIETIDPIGGAAITMSQYGDTREDAIEQCILDMNTLVKHPDYWQLAYAEEEVG